jgi:hypothetical protein
VAVRTDGCRLRHRRPRTIAPGRISALVHLREPNTLREVRAFVEHARMFENGGVDWTIVGYRTGDDPHTRNGNIGLWTLPG